MPERTLYNLKGLKQASIAFALMAMAVFGIQIERMLTGKPAVEFAYMIVLLFCWVIAIWGTRSAGKYGPEFTYAFRAGIVASLATVFAIMLAYRNYASGGGSQAFIQFGVMFMMYTQMMAQLYSYAKILKGSAEICRRANFPNKAKSCGAVWKPCVVIVILTLFAVEIAKLFEGTTVYVITGVAAAVGLIMHFVMIRKIMSVVEVLDGRSTGYRRRPKPQQA